MEVTPETTEQEIKKNCFRVNKYRDEFSALIAYAETPCAWSTLLDDSVEASIQEFINTAYEHIKQHNEDWLEENFV